MPITEKFLGLVSACSDDESITPSGYFCYSYDLESEKLYSVSWYKDNEEFYKYVPSSDRSQHSYQVEGVEVDVSF